MISFLFYLLQVTIASGVLYIYYYLFLRNSRFHQYNRFYLLMATVISLLVPFINIPVQYGSQESIPGMYQLLAAVRVGDTTETAATSVVTWQNLLLFAYTVAALFLLVRFILALLKLRRLFRQHQRSALDNITFIQTRENGTPYSFFSWLFWNEQIPLESQDGQKIFRHELFHIQQKHSWDIIYLQLLTTICWLNPFFHLVKKETTAIHEFLADQFAAGQENQWEYAELLVMQTLQTRQRLVNPFFHNQIKRRIAMITNSSKTSYAYLRKAMALPIAATVIAVLAINCSSKDVNTPAEVETIDIKPVQKTAANDSGRVEEITIRPILKLSTPEPDDNKIFTKVEIEPAFDGGSNGWRKFLQSSLNANVPVDNGAPGGTYTVMVKFIVDKAGQISNIEPTTKWGYGMEQEVVRVMKLSPNWVPAKQAGKSVKAYKMQPVTFVITEE